LETQDGLVILWQIFVILSKTTINKRVAFALLLVLLKERIFPLQAPSTPKFNFKFSKTFSVDELFAISPSRHKRTPFGGLSNFSKFSLTMIV
jgi:hypothetical protein